VTFRVPRQVLVYLYRRDEGDEREFLLLRRTPRGGGFWQGVSGAPEGSESDREAAVREVREETGFGVEAGLVPVDFRYELRARDDNREEWLRTYGPGVDAVPEEVFLAEVPPGAEPVLAVKEHDAYRWCALDEALALLKWAANRDALAAAAARLPAS
jgi:dATP pyrophosphohydrolase